MATCKKCGAASVYCGNPCPICGTRFTVTDGEINEIRAAIDTATKERRYTEAVEGWRLLADNGYTEGEKEYAKLLERGQLVERNLAAATEYYRRASEKNDAYAAFRYSRLMTRENDETALFWLFFSAVLGCVEAYPITAEELDARGLAEDAHYFYSLAAACDDIDSIVTISKRYYNGIGTEASPEYAKWYMDKLTIPPIYAIKLAYKLRREIAKEPPRPLPKNYDAFLKTLVARAKACGFDTARLKLSQILAERGDIDSLTFVGEAFAEGAGCKQSFTEAFHALSAAAARGSARAHIALGNLFSSGKLCERNIPHAIKSYELAGELGCAEGYEIIGDIFYTGTICRANVPEACRYFELAAQAGSAEAQRKLDSIKREREELYSKALSEENPEEAFRLLSHSVAMGHPTATLRLAERLRDGIGIEKSRHEAFFWYKKAAERGEDEALLPLGLCYANGFGTSRDYKRAAEVLTRAERSGIEGATAAILSIMEKKLKKTAHRLYSAAMRLIYMKKFDTAKLYLDIAAELSHAKSIYTLGTLYEFGMGVACDKELAYSLYEKSYSLRFRDPRATYKLTILRMIKSN